MAGMSSQANEARYYGPEKLVLTIDVGNSFSSITVTHLTFGCIPSNALRTVSSFPSHPNCSIAPLIPPLRTPSCIVYDGKEKARAFGAECFTPNVRKRAKEEGWLHISAYKSQMSSNANSDSIAGTKSAGNKLMKKGKSNEFSPPLMKTIYADQLRFLVACARLWFSETTENGDQIFLRLWQTDSIVYVLTHPANWTQNEVKLVKEGIQLADLLLPGFDAGKLVFVKEPTTIINFMAKHTKNARESWLRVGNSFVVCDTAEHGTSIIGYTVEFVHPRIELKVFDPVSRLGAGAGAVTQDFRSKMTRRLSKSKFRQAHHLESLVSEFELHVKRKFTGNEKENFHLRIASEGNDSAAGIENGVLSLTVQEVEKAFKETIDSIIIRLSSVLVKGQAKNLLLAGGFGESAYLQKRLRETFSPRDVSIIVPEIPCHTAVSEGAARFYFSETILPKTTRFEFGISSAADWSRNWVKGSEREQFKSVSGARFILGKWSKIVEKGIKFDEMKPFRKDFHMKHIKNSNETRFKTELYAFDSSLIPNFDGWLTDLSGKVRPEFVKICTVEADLANLISALPTSGEGETEYCTVDVQLLLYIGKSSLEACVAWHENGSEIRAPVSLIAEEFL